MASEKLLALATVPLAALTLLGACAVSPPPAPDGDLLIRPAPIEEVSIAIAESYPPQVIVQIKGGLSDGCTTLHEVHTTRSGNTIDISITTERPRDAICTQIYTFFEQNINLGSDFTSGETYAVKVNDVTKTFVMQ